MEFIYGVTFSPFSPRGTFESAQAKESLTRMRARTAATHVIFAPSGVQETPRSEEIVYTSAHTYTDEELTAMIDYAKGIGLKVILKPTVNCLNGVWRAHINFFDKEVPCEPKWSNWFASHERFQLHYASLAEKTGCAMFIAGCEMVMAQRRDEEWRDLIGKIKRVYSGPVSYNTDKYQEETVNWWDCVDVISSSGYYPFGSWEKELDRIEKVVQAYQKPFFFAETGCMSASGSGMMPNDWGLQGAVDFAEQERWYREMFAHTKNRPWVEGYGLWEWPARLYSESEAARNHDYHFYAKPVEKVIHAAYSEQRSK